MTTPGKKKFDRKIAISVAKELTNWLLGSCERIIVAGSLRRRKLKVGDVEIVYIPNHVERAIDLLSSEQVSAVDIALENLIKAGVIAKRKNVRGSEVWGEKNKLAIHVATGVPVDFFATTPEAWFNYLVCRTGGALNNTRIAEAYQRYGCKWNPYGVGFTDKWGEVHANHSEADVYENAKLRYLHPWERP